MNFLFGKKIEKDIEKSNVVKEKPRSEVLDNMIKNIDHYGKCICKNSYNGHCKIRDRYIRMKRIDFLPTLIMKQENYRDCKGDLYCKNYNFYKISCNVKDNNDIFRKIFEDETYCLEQRIEFLIKCSKEYTIEAPLLIQIINSCDLKNDKMEGYLSSLETRIKAYCLLNGNTEISLEHKLFLLDSLDELRPCYLEDKELNDYILNNTNRLTKDALIEFYKEKDRKWSNVNLDLYSVDKEKLHYLYDKSSLSIIGDSTLNHEDKLYIIKCFIINNGDISKIPPKFRTEDVSNEYKLVKFRMLLKTMKTDKIDKTLKDIVDGNFDNKTSDDMNILKDDLIFNNELLWVKEYCFVPYHMMNNAKYHAYLICNKDNIDEVSMDVLLKLTTVESINIVLNKFPSLEYFFEDEQVEEFRKNFRSKINNMPTAPAVSLSSVEYVSCSLEDNENIPIAEIVVDN